MAKKATLTDVSTGYASGTTLNNNFEALNDKLDNTVSRDGSTPNEMNADLDMNSNDLLNVGRVNADEVFVSGTDVTTYISDSQQAAEDAAALSQAWAESEIAPDGGSGKSSKTWAEEAEASAERVDLGALDDAVAATAADVASTNADVVQTGLDRIATGEDVTTAEAARDAAISAGAWDYTPIDGTDSTGALGDITGMVTGETALVLDTMHVWEYDGADWIDTGLSPLDAKADKVDIDTDFEKNQRIYDLKNRTSFVDGEVQDPLYAPNLSPRDVDYSVTSGELVIPGTGTQVGPNPSVFWMGHVRKASKNTEAIIRITMDAEYTGGSAAGPGAMIYFGDSDLRGYTYTESGRIFGFNGSRGGQTTYGQSPQDTNSIFAAGEEVELRVVIRKDGTGFAIGKKLSNGYELRLDLDEDNLASFGEGKIWVGYDRDTPITVTHFEVNELEVVPEDFDVDTVSSDVSSLNTRVSVLEATAGEKTVKVPFPVGFSMQQDLGFDILRGLTTKSFFTTFDKDDYLLASTADFYVDPVTGDDGNVGSEGAPFATVAQAVTSANSGGAITTIHLASGEYDHEDTGTLPTLTVACNLVCDDNVNRAEVTTASTETGWVLDGTYTNLWKVTVSGDAPIYCYDKGYLDEYGGPSGMIERTQSDANDTAGSFYIDGNTIYVRTWDSREPDSDFRVVRDLAGLNFGAQLFYVENVVFRGGSDYAAVCTNKAGTSCTVNSTFSHSIISAFRWVRNSGSKLVNYRCEAAWSKDQDGFSYATAGSGTDIIEIECFGHHNGIEEGSTNNGSTSHDSTRIIRVNCEHKFNNAKNVADVSSGTLSWNLGVFSGNAQGPDVGNSINFNCETGAEMWVDSCVSDGGSLTDFDVGTGSTIHYRNTPMYETSNRGDGTMERY